MEKPQPCSLLLTTSSFIKKKYPVEFDDKFKIGDVRYDTGWPKKIETIGARNFRL